MSAFLVRPLSAAIASEVRTTRRAPGYGHPVHHEMARGTGPCRECLCAFEVGTDERLLFTYSPFADTATLAQPGPVFIHAASCERHSGAGYPKGLRGIPVVAQAHYRDGSVAAPMLLAPSAEAETLERVLDEVAVSHLHLRHAEAGCFIARVERIAE